MSNLQDPAEPICDPAIAAEFDKFAMREFPENMVDQLQKNADELIIFQSAIYKKWNINSSKTLRAYEKEGIRFVVVVDTDGFVLPSESHNAPQMLLFYKGAFYERYDHTSAIKPLSGVPRTTFPTSLQEAYKVLQEKTTTPMLDLSNPKAAVAAAGVGNSVAGLSLTARRSAVQQPAALPSSSTPSRIRLANNNRSGAVAGSTRPSAIANPSALPTQLATTRGNRVLPSRSQEVVEDLPYGFDLPSSMRIGHKFEKPTKQLPDGHGSGKNYKVDADDWLELLKMAILTVNRRLKPSDYLRLTEAYNRGRTVAHQKGWNTMDSYIKKNAGRVQDLTNLENSILL